MEFEKEHTFSFEKLEVWQLARKLTIEIYKLTESFPIVEKYALVQQIKRSATSICANLAEGSTRITNKDQSHFTTIAFGSLIELYNHLIIAHDLNFLPLEKLEGLKIQVKLLSQKLSNYKRAQINRK